MCQYGYNLRLFVVVEGLGMLMHCDRSIKDIHVVCRIRSNREGAKNSGGKKAGLLPATGKYRYRRPDRLVVLGDYTLRQVTSENSLVRYLSGQTQRGQRRE